MINKIRKIYNAKIVTRQLNKKNNPNYLISSNKILLIGHNSDKQGAAVLLEYIAKECVAQGWQVVLLVRNPGDMVIRYTKICKTECFVGKEDFNRKIKKYKNKGFSNAICNTTVNGDLVIPLKENGYKVETLVHELSQVIINSHIEDRARLIATESDRVVFPSSYVYGKIKELSEVKEYIIQPQGLYLTGNHEYDLKRSFENINQEIDIKDKKLVINVATPEYRKGFDIFLKVAKDMERYQKILFIWIGGGNDTIYKEIIGEREQKNLKILGYIDSPEKLAQIYDCASILLLTSREEPFGSIVLEAFHSKTPVIGFKDAGGFVDTVLPGITGELVEYENIKSMEETLSELLSDAERLEQYGNNCLKLSQSYKFDKYVERITELFYEQ